MKNKIKLTAEQTKELNKFLEGRMIYAVNYATYERDQYWSKFSKEPIGYKFKYEEVEDIPFIECIYVLLSFTPEIIIFNDFLTDNIINDLEARNKFIDMFLKVFGLSNKFKNDINTLINEEMN